MTEKPKTYSDLYELEQREKREKRAAAERERAAQLAAKGGKRVYVPGGLYALFQEAGDAEQFLINYIDVRQQRDTFAAENRQLKTDKEELNAHIVELSNMTASSRQEASKLTEAQSQIVELTKQLADAQIAAATATAQLETAMQMHQAALERLSPAVGNAKPAASKAKPAPQQISPVATVPDVPKAAAQSEQVTPKKRGRKPKVTADQEPASKDH